MDILKFQSKKQHITDPLYAVFLYLRAALYQPVFYNKQYGNQQKSHKGRYKNSIFIEQPIAGHANKYNNQIYQTYGLIEFLFFVKKIEENKGKYRNKYHRNGNEEFLQNNLKTADRKKHGNQ
jgi:hypothetical protein